MSNLEQLLAHIDRTLAECDATQLPELTADDAAELRKRWERAQGGAPTWEPFAQPKPANWWRRILRRRR